MEVFVSVTMKYSVFIVLSLMTLVSGENQLSVDEVLARVNRLPTALQNVVSRATNEVHLRKTAIENSRRIVGGEKTTIEDNPYQVSLHYTNVHICGGSIISDSWVLTAAHCLDWGPRNMDITIRSGSSSRTTGGTIHPIYYYHIHEEYHPTDYPRDVATIRVRLPFSGSARAIVPLTSSEWINGDVTISGWGKNTQGIVPDTLWKAVIPVVGRATCNAKWDGLIMEDMICAGDIGTDSCDGDSGGPAVQNGIQYGIVSWGGTICGSALPGVYTNIAHPAIRDFITRTTMV